MELYKFKDIVKVEIKDGDILLTVQDKGVDASVKLKCDYLVFKAFEKMTGKPDSEFAKVLILALKAIG